MLETGLHKPMEPHLWDAGSMRNHAPSSPQKNLSPMVPGAQKLGVHEIACHYSRVVCNLSVFLDSQILLVEQLAAVAKKGLAQLHLDFLDQEALTLIKLCHLSGPRSVPNLL